MSEATQSSHYDEVPVCTWCNRPLLPEESARGQVCKKCVRLLRSAGIPDEEIFIPAEEE